MSEPEMLTLSELLIFRSVLEFRAARLRRALHELRRTRPSGWQQDFARVQAELIATAARIGEFSRRIHWLVKGEHDNERIAL
jgi:hypothetical protein